MCNCNIVMCVNTDKAGSARVAVAVGAVTLTAVEVHKGLWAQRGHAAPAPGGQRVPRGQGIGPGFISLGWKNMGAAWLSRAHSVFEGGRGHTVGIGVPGPSWVGGQGRAVG